MPFNTTFTDSLYRLAQIVWDLQYKGLPIAFSWADGTTETVVTQQACSRR